MRVDRFNYELPPERIAQHPAEDPESARLMVLPSDGAILHAHVGDLAEHIPEGALVVTNDTRVIPARLVGQKAETGGRVEVFLVKRKGPYDVEVDGKTRKGELWRALGKSSKPLRFGTDVRLGTLTARLLGRSDEDGLLEVALFTDDGQSIQDAIQAYGRVPLPPYIKRDPDAADADRYQTIFARVEGAIAAPTAGLHMTRALVGRLAVKGCEVVSVTLHVGLGTFQPVTVEDLDDHPMHTEQIHVSESTAKAIARARERGRPVVAVGTTVTRTLESAADPDRVGFVRPTTGETSLLIQPGHKFRVVDLMLTNFHLPRSTLLAMVCAFGGIERMLHAYEVAVNDAYRFFSYGDAMLIARAPEAAAR